MANGNYYYVKTPNDLISVISLWAYRGSSLDPKGKEGLSHFFEHLFLNKTSHLPNKIAVLRKIDGLGLFFNAYTRKNSVYYYFIQQADAQEDAYKILIDGLNEFSVDEESINKERDVILNEQNQFKANPAVYLWNLADRGLWPGSPLSDSGLGSNSSLYSITLNDIQKYKQLLFSPSNIGFLTISSLEISKSLEQQLVKLTTPKGEETEAPQSAYALGNAKQIVCENRPSDSVFIALSFPLPCLKDLLKDKLHLDFIRNYLASGWSSRLIERLRLEKNYTYWVYGGIESFNEAGFFRVSLSTSKKNISNVISIVSEEIEKIQQEKLDEQNLSHHKNAMKAHLLKHYIQPENMMWWYGWNIFLAHRVITIGDYLDSIDSIVSSDIQLVAQKYLQLDKMHIAALGNISVNEVQTNI